MKTITLVTICDDSIGEAQGVFLDGELIGAWSSNDADYRPEYMNGFMKKLGIIVKTKEATEKDTKAIGEWLGVTW